MNKLGQSVRLLTDMNELAEKLARILDIARVEKSVTYEQVEAIAGNNAEDLLLVAWEWRLLIPIRTSRCGEWDDRVLVLSPGEKYEMPNVSRLMVKYASITGVWDSSKAVTAFFEDAGEPLWRLIPSLVQRMKEGCPSQGIDARQIKVACREMGFGERTDTIIAILKGAGVISPKLGSLSFVSRTQTPLYEINPLLFIEKSSEISNTTA